MRWSKIRRTLAQPSISERVYRRENPVQLSLRRRLFQNCPVEILKGDKVFLGQQLELTVSSDVFETNGATHLVDEKEKVSIIRVQMSCE